MTRASQSFNLQQGGEQALEPVLELPDVPDRDAGRGLPAKEQLEQQLIARRPDMRLFGAEDAMRGIALARGTGQGVEFGKHAGEIVLQLRIAQFAAELRQAGASAEQTGQGAVDAIGNPSCSCT